MLLIRLRYESYGFYIKLGRFRLCKYMIKNCKLDPSKMHLIGHSVGAHVLAYLAKAISGIFQLTGK